jgi:hypothetical protein
MAVTMATGDQHEGRVAAEPQRFYANAIAAHPGVFDLVLDFGFLLGDERGDAEYQARVAMSWEHAAALTKILQGLIAQYEDQLGALPNVEKAREAAP